MDADFLLHAAHSPLGAILGVLTAIALVIFLACVWNRELSAIVLLHLQYMRQILLYPLVLIYRLYWHRDRLFISIPLGTQIETSYYVREEPNAFFSVDEIGTLVFAIPGVIWVRYRRDHGDVIRSHLLLNTLVSVAQVPTPLQTIHSGLSLTSNPATERSSLDLLARTSLNIIPQLSLPEVAHLAPSRPTTHTALTLYEDTNTYDFNSPPTPPPSLASVVSMGSSIEQYY
ncbi:hypothetical protein FRC12_001667 [Ceratobasidium sp. 428]|nr:hypothetical protein FRC12_001667 [Ceratobasidium sp. 428]